MGIVANLILLVNNTIIVWTSDNTNYNHILISYEKILGSDYVFHETEKKTNENLANF